MFKNKEKNCRFISCVCAFMMLINCFAFADSEVVISDKYTVSDGVTLTLETLVDSKNNNHKSFVVEYAPDAQNTSMEFLYGSNLNTRNTVTQLIADAKDVEGSAVVAMNADFFNMATGLAESIIIRDGVLLTSDRDNYAFAFDAQGVPFIEKPAVSMVLNTPYKEYTVLHYNKEFTRHGLYLYSEHYGKETKISEPTVELILAPYSEGYDYEGMCALMLGDNAVPFDLEEVTVDEDGNETVVINERYKSDIEAYAFENGYIQVGMWFYKPTTANAFVGETMTSYIKEIRYNSEGESLEIPEGSFVLAANEETQAFKFEKLVEGDKISVTFNCNERFIGVKEAIGCGALIVDNSTVIEHTNLSHYASANPRTAIGITADNKIIMFAVDGRQGSYSKGMTLKELSDEMIRLGCVYAANLDGGGSTVVKAVTPITQKLTTVNSPSEGSERKVSNAIAFYNLAESDGKSVYSYLNSENRLVLSNSSLELGQAYFTDKAYYPTEVSPIKKNDREKNIAEREQMVTDDEILSQLLNISSSREENNTEEERIVYDYKGFVYSVDEGKGIVEDGLYMPDGYEGDVYIISTSPDGFTNEAVRFTSLGEVDSIALTGVTETMFVGEEYDLSAKATYKGFDVVGGDECFTWRTSNKYSLAVDGTGKLKAVSAGINIKITVSFGETKKVIYINVEELPFGDIVNNWARNNIVQIYDKGITNGELTSDGRMYFPSRTFTRTEFCVMLSRLLGFTAVKDASENVTDDALETVVEETVVETETEATTETESDVLAEESETVTETEVILESETETQNETEVITVSAEEFFFDYESIPDWARESIDLLFENNCLVGFEHENENGKVFDGSQLVTRREVIRLIGNLVPKAPENFDPKLSDVTVNDPDYQYIINALNSNIFTGYLDGTLRADSNLTRAEAAAVFTRLLKAIDNN